MPILIWTGTAVAILAAIALLAMAWKARGLISSNLDDAAQRQQLRQLAAFNAGIVGVGAIGLGLMVVGAVL